MISYKVLGCILGIAAGLGTSGWGVLYTWAAMMADGDAHAEINKGMLTIGAGAVITAVSIFFLVRR